MNDELSYAEMLEIPVETVTVKRREKKKGRARADEASELEDRLVEQVNSHMTEDDPAYAESTPIEREERPKKQKRRVAHAVLITEFVAVFALCAVIFLTNIFMTDSAINTFVRGLFRGTAQTADTRLYSDFTLSPIVSDNAEVEIAVSDTGILSFVGNCSVYSPCAGTVSSVHGSSEEGYTVEIKHSDKFSTILSGLDTVFAAEGDRVYQSIPVAYSKGENTVRVMFYAENKLLTNVCVKENGLAWS